MSLGNPSNVLNKTYVIFELLVMTSVVLYSDWHSLFAVLYF